MNLQRPPLYIIYACKRTRTIGRTARENTPVHLDTSQGPGHCGQLTFGETQTHIWKKLRVRQQIFVHTIRGSEYPGDKHRVHFEPNFLALFGSTFGCWQASTHLILGYHTPQSPRKFVAKQIKQRLKKNRTQGTYKKGTTKGGRYHQQTPRRC